MTMKIHNLVQGTPEWDQFRMEHNGASEAAAMLGLSPKVKRTELLRAKKTGIAREFSDWVQANILEPGHAMEAAARPFVEEIIGDDLYPVTCSLGKESASCDGLTLEARIAFEHKRWNVVYAAMVAAGQVPEEHMPQCQQVLMVTGAEKLIFVMSDGTRENMVYVWVLPDPDWFKRLRAGWVQFEIDKAEFVPTAPTVQAVAAPMESLPAVSVQLQGQLVVASNLPQFDTALRAFIDRIPAKASTDQEFADTEAACKALKKAEEALDAADEHSLASLSDVAAARKLMADLRNLARTTRLAKEKDVAARKEQIRHEIVADGRQQLAEHLAALVQRLGKPYLPAIPEDFGGVIKGKKTVASLRDAVATELARAKIAANEIADRIALNLATLREKAAAHAFLFADTAQLVLKAPDDLAAIVTARIGEHETAKAEEKRKAEEETQRRIKEAADAAEAKAKQDAEDEAAEAVRAAQAKAAEHRRMLLSELEGVRQQVAIARMGRQGVRAGGTLQCMVDTLEETKRWKFAADYWGDMLQVAESTKADAVAAIEAMVAEAMKPAPTTAAPAPTPAPAVVQMPARAEPPADTGAATLLIGGINRRLGYDVSAVFLKQLGFEPARIDGARRFYRDSDLPLIGQAIARHTLQVTQLQAAAA